MDWQYVEQGEQKGPVTDEELGRLFVSGRIDDQTFVWHQGLPEWVAYKEIKATLTPLPVTPPPLPPPLPPDVIPGPGEVVCAECLRKFPASDTIQYREVHICAGCKPVFLQKLAESSEIGRGRTLPYARIPRRFIAMVLDLLILTAVNFGVSFVMGKLIPLSGPRRLSSGFLTLQLASMGINMAIGIAYEVLFIGKYGATPGKMACKIKIVTADGGPVSYARALGRYFAKILSSLPCFAGYIMAIFDKQKRALHDYICNTRVVATN